MMLAYRRIDVETLNHAARTLLRRDDQLGDDRHTTPDGRGFAIGDSGHLPPQRADPRRQQRHPRRPRRHQPRPASPCAPPAGDRRLPSRYVDDGHLTHAYAMTGHKSQGQTVDHAFVLAPDRGDLKEWAYVTASRARDETRIYLAETSLDPEHEPPPCPRRTATPLERLAAAASRPANERLATDPVRPEPSRS